MHLTVETSIPLREELKNNLQQKLETLWSTKLTITWVTDPSLLGGLRLISPTKVVDLSLAAKLNQLSQSLSQ